MNEKINQAGMNTDRELWREISGDHYSPAIHVTESGAIGMNVGGIVIVMPVQEWHRLASMRGKATSELVEVSPREDIAELLESSRKSKTEQEFREAVGIAVDEHLQANYDDEMIVDHERRLNDIESIKKLEQQRLRDVETVLSAMRYSPDKDNVVVFGAGMAKADAIQTEKVWRRIAKDPVRPTDIQQQFDDKVQRFVDGFAPVNQPCDCNEHERQVCDICQEAKSDQPTDKHGKALKVGDKVRSIYSNEVLRIIHIGKDFVKATGNLDSEYDDVAVIGGHWSQFELLPDPEPSAFDFLKAQKQAIEQREAKADISRVVECACQVIDEVHESLIAAHAKRLIKNKLRQVLGYPERQAESTEPIAKDRNGVELRRSDIAWFIGGDKCMIKRIVDDSRCELETPGVLTVVPSKLLILWRRKDA